MPSISQLDHWITHMLISDSVKAFKVGKQVNEDKAGRRVESGNKS